MNSIRQPPQDDPAIVHPDQFIRVQTGATMNRLFRVPSEHELRWGREPYALEEEPDPAIRRVIEEEGARPSSLISVHKPLMPDPLHNMQLLKDLQIINERMVKELGPLPPGGLPVQAKRKPKPWQTYEPSQASVNSEHEHGEDETMKLTQLAAITALVAGMAASNPATSAASHENVASTDHATQTQKTSAASAYAGSASEVPTKGAAPPLGPKFKISTDVTEFRKKLLADGWQPVVNPKCRDVVMMVADVADKYCNILPETAWASGSGYYLLHYIKNGTPLTITAYGEMEALYEPDSDAGFWVTGWDYSYEDVIEDDLNPYKGP